MPTLPFSEARALLAELLAAGHAVTAGPGGALCVTKSHALCDVLRLLIAIRKEELLALLFDSADDERVMCRECFHLEHAGNCAAAARGRMRGVPRWYLPPRDVLWRCPYFCPMPGTGARAVWNTATTPNAGACAIPSAPYGHAQQHRNPAETASDDERRTAAATPGKGPQRTASPARD